MHHAKDFLGVGVAGGGDKITAWQNPLLLRGIVHLQVFYYLSAITFSGFATIMCISEQERHKTFHSQK